jgi:hypothetical protein
MNDYYMVPECRRAKAIRLYKAVTFPTQWSLVGTLLRGSFVDASIFHNGDRWWLFTEANPEPKWDTLCLYHADNLMGPWVPHLKSPIIKEILRSQTGWQGLASQWPYYSLCPGLFSDLRHSGESIRNH